MRLSIYLPVCLVCLPFTEFVPLTVTDEVREVREPNYDPDNPAIKRELEKLATWDFDIIAMERLCDCL